MNVKFLDNLCELFVKCLYLYFINLLKNYRWASKKVKGKMEFSVEKGNFMTSIQKSATSRPFRENW